MQVHSPSWRSILVGLVLGPLFSASFLYTCLVTGVGAWPAPTAALIVNIVLYFVGKKSTESGFDALLPYLMASSGAVIAAAFAFSIPTFYLALPDLFTECISQKALFYSFFTFFIACSALIGLGCARSVYAYLTTIPSVTFPVSRMAFDTFAVTVDQSVALLVIGGIACALCILGFSKWLFIVSGSMFLMQVSAPVGWAVGFFARFPLTFAIGVGALFRMFIVTPFWGDELLIRSSIATGLMCVPLLSGALWLVRGWSIQTVKEWALWGLGVARSLFTSPTDVLVWRSLSPVSLVAMLGVVAMFLLDGMHAWGIVIVLLAAIPAAYQLVLLATQAGICPLGRVMTAVMIVLMSLRLFSPQHLVYATIFVGISIATLIDSLFVMHLASLLKTGITKKRIERWYILGVIVAALTTTLFFMALYSQYGLEPGSILVNAHRGSMRAIILQAFSWDYSALAVGFVAGVVGMKCNLHPALLLAGLIIPEGLTLALFLGGCVQRFSQNAPSVERVATGFMIGDALWSISSSLMLLCQS